jgi:Mor family transcriptional regulator
MNDAIALAESDDEPFRLEAQSASEAADLARLAALDKASWPKLLADLVDIAAAALAPRRGDPEAAEEDARLVVAAWARYQGGRSVYLPRGHELETALVHDAIYRASKRGNGLLLARQHGYAERSVQRIVAQQTALRRKRMQPELFPDGGSAQTG